MRRGSPTRRWAGGWGSPRPPAAPGSTGPGSGANTISPYRKEGIPIKTIHPIPPAGSEEALIQALETLLAQENPDEARLQALLDQLDRQTGAAPLDPEAGWADLQRRRSARPKRRSLRRFPLALAAVLVCLAVSGTALAVNFGLHEKLADLFQVNESNQTLVADAIDTPEAVYQKDGITITVKQTIADDTSIYAIYEVTVPEDITIPETAEPAAGVLLPQPESSEESGHQNAGGGYHEILEQGPHHWVGLAVSETLSEPITDDPVRLIFVDFGYDTADGIHVPLAEDTIVLEWPLQKSNRTRTFDLNQTLIVEGQQPGILKGLSLSPISLNLYTSHLHLDTDTLTLSLVFQDGTTVPVDNPSGEIYSGSTLEDTWASFHYTFHTPIDPAQVTAVQIGDQTFPLP